MKQTDYKETRRIAGRLHKLNQKRILVDKRRAQIEQQSDTMKAEADAMTEELAARGVCSVEGALRHRQVFIPYVRQRAERWEKNEYVSSHAEFTCPHCGGENTIDSYPDAGYLRRCHGTPPEWRCERLLYVRVTREKFDSIIWSVNGEYRMVEGHDIPVDLVDWATTDDGTWPKDED